MDLKKIKKDLCNEMKLTYDEDEEDGDLVVELFYSGDSLGHIFIETEDGSIVT